VLERRTESFHLVDRNIAWKLMKVLTEDQMGRRVCLKQRLCLCKDLLAHLKERYATVSVVLRIVEAEIPVLTAANKGFWRIQMVTEYDTAVREDHVVDYLAEFSRQREKL